MAERLQQNQFDEVGVNPFNAPVPGESLTASPETPKAWERPPQYVDDDKAMEALYLLITEQEKLRGLISIINEGVPLEEIAQVVLYQGYTAGQYSSDLMLTMIEPTLYLLIAIADYADIKDYVLYEGEDDDPDTEIPNDDVVPVDMDGDGIPDEPTEETKTSKEKPDDSSVDESLLARIKTELPSKVKEVTMENGE